MRYIAFFILTLLLNANYSQVGNIVTDDATNLQWQNDSQVSSTLLTWSEAIKFCEDLELDNYTDWRLPNIVELSSIIDFTQAQPVIADIFENRAGDFWSSTTTANDDTQAWIVIFNNGIQYFRDKDEENFVRCVRGGL